MGACYGLAFFGINELVVTVSLRVAVTTSQAAKDELLTWKIKEYCEKLCNHETFLACGIRCKHCTFPGGNKTDWGPLHC